MSLRIAVDTFFPGWTALVWPAFDLVLAIGTQGLPTRGRSLGGGGALSRGVTAGSPPHRHPPETPWQSRSAGRRIASSLLVGRRVRHPDRACRPRSPHHPIFIGTGYFQKAGDHVAVEAEVELERAQRRRWYRRRSAARDAAGRPSAAARGERAAVPATARTDSGCRRDVDEHVACSWAAKPWTMMVLTGARPACSPANPPAPFRACSEQVATVVTR